MENIEIENSERIVEEKPMTAEDFLEEVSYIHTIADLMQMYADYVIDWYIRNGKSIENK